MNCSNNSFDDCVPFIDRDNGMNCSNNSFDDCDFYIPVTYCITKDDRTCFRDHG